MKNQEWKKDSSVRKYNLPGEPISWAGPLRDKNLGQEDGIKLRRLNASIYLERQHEDQPLLNGPLIFKASFYFKGGPEGKFFLRNPPLTNLLRFIQVICRGIVYADNNQIVYCEAKKYYSPVPRTEIFIMEDL